MRRGAGRDEQREGKEGRWLIWIQVNGSERVVGGSKAQTMAMRVGNAGLRT